MNHSTAPAQLETELEWVRVTYSEEVSKKCRQVIAGNPQIRDDVDIAELAWAISSREPRPEIRFDVESASRPPVPRRTFREWLRDLFPF